MFMLVGHHEINPCESLLICLYIVMEHNEKFFKETSPKGFSLCSSFPPLQGASFNEVYQGFIIDKPL